MSVLEVPPPEPWQKDPVIRRVVAALILLIFLGLVATTASVVSARTSQAATAAQVDRNAELTRELRQLTAAQAEESRRYRSRAEIRQLIICDRLTELERALQVPVGDPCPPPVVPTTPLPPAPDLPD